MTNENLREQTVRDYLKQKRRKTATETTAQSDMAMAKSVVKPIRISELQIAGYAQRKFIKSWGDHISDNFNEDLFTPIIVSCRGGAYYILDGQHRKYAIKKRFGNDFLVDCRVIYGLTEREESEMFVKLNTSHKALRYSDLVRGRFYADDPKITELVRICTECGVELGFEYDNRQKKDGRITAVKTLSDTYDKLGSKQTQRLVKLINDTWDGKAEGFSQKIISAMCLVLTLYGDEISDTLWIKKLSKSDPSTLIYAARNDTATRADIPTKIARIMVTNFYNKGRGSKPLTYKFGV